MGDKVNLARLAADMADEVREGPAVFHPSRFWEQLATVNEEQLSDLGFESFKRTINQNYFNWLISSPWNPQFTALIKEWLTHPVPVVAAARLVDWSTIELAADGERRAIAGARRRRLGHAVFIALLWEYARRRDRQGWLSVSEPSLGSPILVRHRGRLVSQDVANSVIELASIAEAFPAGIPQGAQVIELGGGYGRLGWLMLSVLPGVRYVAVDIPPALAVAQEYLTRLFPDLPVARFQRGTAHLPGALEHARMAFLTPNQLDSLEPLHADLFVNISSLHEMRRDQIARYFELIDRHTRGVFFTKQWIASINRSDELVIRQADYPVPEHWERIFERRHRVQSHFFEAAYGVHRRHADDSDAEHLPHADRFSIQSGGASA